MSKIMQECFLVVYKEERDYLEKVEWFKNRAFEGKWKHYVKDRKMVVVNPNPTQECYYFVKFDGNVARFLNQIGGAQYVGVIFLSGEYPSSVINFSLYRCRGGRWEVESI